MPARGTVPGIPGMGTVPASGRNWYHARYQMNLRLLEVFQMGSTQEGPPVSAAAIRPARRW